MNLIITKSGINRMRAAIINKYGTQPKIMTYCLLSRRLSIEMRYIFLDRNIRLYQLSTIYSGTIYQCWLFLCFDRHKRLL